MKVSIRLMIVAAGLFATSSAYSVPKAPKNWEKCLGVAAAGKNDCGSVDKSHSCAGMSKKADDKNEWVYVAEGTCEKLGGKVWKKVKAK